MSRNLRRKLGLSDADTARLELLTNDYIEYALVRVEPEDLAAVEGVEMDSGDRHVLAAALAADADILLTDNTRHFPREWMTDHDIELLTAGELLLRIAEQFPDKIRAAQETTLRFSPKSEGEVLATLEAIVGKHAAGSTHKFLDWLTGQRLSYSVGFSLPDSTPDLLALIPEHVWASAYDAHDQVRDGAWVAELTGLLDLKGWPAGMRVIARKERPHPGAQLRITDVEGHRVTAFASNTRSGGQGAQLADLELRHRRRARCEDRIRVAKDTGMTNLPLRSFDQNRIWCALIALAVEITAWMQMLTLAGHDARRWEPKRLRHRLFSVPAALARTGRRVLLHLSQRAPWAALVHQAITRLRARAQPG